MDETEMQTDSTDILDTAAFGTNAKLFSCQLCGQRFTNKLKITLHWVINHGYKLCEFRVCNSLAFKYDSDRIRHEREHIPFGCSSCEHEFDTIKSDIISEHYKKIHGSFLCSYCSSVIDPFSKYPEHIEKRHLVSDYKEFLAGGSKLFEMIGDQSTDLFHCKMCKKSKRTNLFGHYVFHHNMSIHALKVYLDEDASGIKINGVSTEKTPDVEAVAAGRGRKNSCSICENPIQADESVHEVFCQGLIMCKQKECDQLFENNQALTKHLDFEHPESTCKFGCRETKLKAREIDGHLQTQHDIVECNLCDIVNSSGNYKNHLRDKHSVNLMTFEKATNGRESIRLYRVEGSPGLRNSRQVLCNFCDHDITKEIREFSFVRHYQNEHEIGIPAILRHLGKNPIIDTLLSERKEKSDDSECLKNFTVTVENSIDELIETDFDTSKVCCIGVDTHKGQNEQMDDDEDSPIACEFCKKSSFDGSCQLYEHLNETHGFQLLNVTGQCKTCPGASVIKLEPMSDDEDSKKFNLSLVCPLDASFHVTKDNFKAHMSKEHLDQTLVLMDNIIYKCFECNFAYNKLEDIRSHFKELHPDIKMSYCSICRIKLTNPNENSTHFNDEHGEVIKQVEKWRCKLCKKAFTKKHKAKTHYDRFHKRKELHKKAAFKCQHKLCQDAFPTKESRKMHQMIAHPDEKLFPCKSCTLKFTTKSSLNSHNLIHKNVLNTCSFCQKTFLRRDSYKEHLLIHSGVRHKCSFCEKNFVQRSNLVRHERIHLNEKPYKCTFCEKTFSDKGACNSHEKVHTKSEHSNCEVCGKHFARKQKLKYHMRIHTLENVLTCDCGKIFTESYSFRKHKETHLKNRSDKCEECGKIFKSAKAKGEHMVTVHGISFPEAESLIETKIQCMLCNLKDFTMETIKDHLNSVHTIEETDDWENYIGEVEFEMEESLLGI